MVEAGLRDLARGVESPEALVVASFAPRLRRLGIKLPDRTIEARLYRYPDIDPASFRLAVDESLGPEPKDR